jgi:hypothetical protein
LFYKQCDFKSSWPRKASERKKERAEKARERAKERTKRCYILRILSSPLRSRKWPLSMGFPHQTSVWISPNYIDENNNNNNNNNNNMAVIHYMTIFLVDDDYIGYYSE